MGWPAEGTLNTHVKNKLINKNQTISTRGRTNNLKTTSFMKRRTESGFYHPLPFECRVYPTKEGTQVSLEKMKQIV